MTDAIIDKALRDAVQIAQTLPCAPPLRWYQRDAVDAFFAYVASTEGDPLIVLPTGSGKSLTMASIIARARANAPTMRVAILATQAELVQQNVRAAALCADRADIGIYSAGLGQKDATRPITVANIQSLARVAYAFDPFDLLLIDEAHTIADADSGMYRSFIAAQRMQNPALVIAGFTATPYKLSSGTLTGGTHPLFHAVAYDADIVRLITEGFLCRPITPRARVRLDTSAVPLRGGEFVAKALAEAVDVTAMTDAACDEIVRLCADRQHWLVFAVSVAHAQHIAEALTARGIPTAMVHGELPRDERAHRLDAFTSGAVRALVNVQLLTTGFDFPAVDAIVLMRPTKSPGLFAQMIGRGMRPHPSKSDCLVVDLCGAIELHGPVDAIRVRDKKATNEPGEAPAKLCPTCEFYQPAGCRVCVQCGHEFPPPAVVQLHATASTAAILSVDITPTWYDVTNVRYEYHEPRAPKTTPTLRAEYFDGMRRVASEWVCLEHVGYARTKAESWWRERSPDRTPATVEDALLVSDDLRAPTRIGVLPDGKYERIARYEWADTPRVESGLPRACWSCTHWSPTSSSCTHWHATPPDDVIAAGCDAWDDEIEVPF